MTSQKTITASSLAQLIAELSSEQFRVLAPVRSGERVLFKEVSSMDQIASDYITTTVSPKEAFLPRCESILKWRTEGREIHLQEETFSETPTVVFGLRPCDARATHTLRAVYLTDYADPFFKTKFDSTLCITLSCRKCDDHCFCVSTGGGPDDPSGSDLLLTELQEDRYLVDLCSEKGEALVSRFAHLFSGTTKEEPQPEKAPVKKVFDPDELRLQLRANFDSPVWEEQSLRCLGCGACAFVCPTCSCFDLQDETCGPAGLRLRCWDSCGLSQFTIHASGHNPRDTQAGRWRQRIMHKFSYQQQQLGLTGCVGCGRCSRACPADMNLLEHLLELAAETAAD